MICQSCQKNSCHDLIPNPDIHQIKLLKYPHRRTVGHINYIEQGKLTGHVVGMLIKQMNTQMRTQHALANIIISIAFN